jgi:hypothetical protein
MEGQIKIGKWTIRQSGQSIQVYSSYSARSTRRDHADWPIRYWDGRIAYDFPERVPLYVKKIVSRLYRRMSI